jgi:hypothetical protein
MTVHRSGGDSVLAARNAPVFFKFDVVVPTMRIFLLCPVSPDNNKPLSRYRVLKKLGVRL